MKNNGFIMGRAANRDIPSRASAPEQPAQPFPDMKTPAQCQNNDSTPNDNVPRSSTGATPESDDRDNHDPLPRRSNWPKLNHHHADHEKPQAAKAAARRESTDEDYAPEEPSMADQMAKQTEALGDDHPPYGTLPKRGKPRREEDEEDCEEEEPERDDPEEDDRDEDDHDREHYAKVTEKAKAYGERRKEQESDDDEGDEGDEEGERKDAPAPTLSEQAQEIARNNARPHADGPRWSSYNFSDDFQDTILACIIRRPDDFLGVAGLIKPAYFNGPQAVELVFRIQEYQKKYGKYPNFTVLGNYAFHKAARSNVDYAKEVGEYVAKLSEIDTRDWEPVRDLALDFARERAIYDSLRKIHAAQSEGKMDKINPMAVIEQALSVGTSMKPQSDADLLAEKIEDAEPVIETLLDRGMLAMFGASSKSHKTWANLMLACGVAYKGNWLGFTCRKGRVLYVNFELSKRAMQDRLDAVYKKLSITAGKGIDFLHLKGVEFDPVSLLQSLVSQCKERGYSLVIIDPLYMFESSGGSSKSRNGDSLENSNTAMLQVMVQFIALATKANCALWVCHHFGKGNQAAKDMLDRFVGAGVIGRALDTAVTFTKHKASDPAKGVKAYTVEFDARNHKEIEPFVVRWEYPLLVKAPELNPADLAQPATGKPKGKSTEDLLKLLPNSGLKNKEWQAKAEEEGIKRTLYYDLRRELKEAGLVVEENGKFVPGEPLK